MKLMHPMDSGFLVRLVRSGFLVGSPIADILADPCVSISPQELPADAPIRFSDIPQIRFGEPLSSRAILLTIAGGTRS